MSYWQGLILGVVQGLTEFLPISSSGHLVVAEAALGMTTPGVVIEVALHVATLLAVVIVYRRRLLELTHGFLTRKRPALFSVVLLFVGTLPAAFVGILLADVFEAVFDSLLIVGVNFVVTGLILWSTRWVRSASKPEPNVAGAGMIGVAQALAILPGISRSGTTVAAGLWLGIDPVKAAEFSFLLAIPAIAGAAVLQIPELSSGALDSIGWGPLFVSFVAALVAGVVAIQLLVWLLRGGIFHRFAPYCWGIGVATIVWALAG